MRSSRVRELDSSWINSPFVRYYMAITSIFLLINVTVRYLPSWFPGTEFKKFAESERKYCTEILEGPFKNTKNSWVSVIVLSVISTFPNLKTSYLFRSSLATVRPAMLHDYSKNSEGPQFLKKKNNSSRKLQPCYMLVSRVLVMFFC